MATGKFVAYYRVSTQKQGRSGLGLEAQKQAVQEYLNGGKWKLVAEFTEIESGKKDDRPELAKALHRAKVTGATLVVAKLDRLSRNVAFLANLQESKVSFVCCDMKDATEFTINILAAVAQHERKLISERTKNAMAAAKKRGVKFGNPGDAKSLRGLALGNKAAVPAIQAKADKFARENIIPVIEDIRAAGMSTLREIADELNAREIKTARGGKWHAMTVRNVLARDVA